MLTNKTKKSPHQPDSVADVPNDDPWKTPIPVEKTKTVPQNWHFPTETYPLISSAGKPGAPRLISHQSTSEEILLGDELKLHVNTHSLLQQQLAKALALIYWLNTIPQTC